MSIGPITANEFGILLLASLPWLIPIALAAAAIGLLRLSARARARSSDAVERERRSP